MANITERLTAVLKFFSKPTRAVKNLFKKIRQRILDEIQFRQFAQHVHGQRTITAAEDQHRCKLIIIDGNDHEIIWAIRWSTLIQPFLRKGYRLVVLTRRASAIQNKYYWLFGCKRFLFIDDFFKKKRLPKELRRQLDEIFHSADVKSALLNFHYNGLPVGRITLSGYSRYHFRGHVDFHSLTEMKGLRKLFCKNLMYACYAKDFLERPDIYITSEAFHDEHGIFYYYMLNRDVNVIKMNLSVMDECMIVQKRNQTNDGMHHNMVTKTTFDHIQADKDIKVESVRAFVESNFADRYSAKWHLSKRNFRNTVFADRQQIIKEYGLDPGKKIAVIFSHVLYDTLYFFEKEIYQDYTAWLIDTIQTAIQNDHVNWLLKLHPSNSWRGEFHNESEYEEVRIIKKAFGQLPDHVKLVYPSTMINPLSWIKHADFGITVRGTIGMEMPCFGRHVITAASGRYTHLGFTIDPEDKEKYRDTLRNLQAIPSMTDDQIRLALYYYYTIFALKPLQLSMLKPVVRMGFKEVRLFGSMYSMPTAPIDLCEKSCAPEVESFAVWAEKKDCIDYIKNWEKYCV